MDDKLADRYREAIKNAYCMTAAAAVLGVHFNTFKRNAKKLGLYAPMERKEISRRGGLSNPPPIKYKLEDILKGHYPQYSTYHLSKRLQKEKIIPYECNRCGNPGWFHNEPLTLDLDHIDGDRTNHKLNNLRFLCPNCHSQTDTYKSKNRRIKGR